MSTLFRAALGGILIPLSLSNESTCLRKVRKIVRFRCGQRRLAESNYRRRASLGRDESRGDRTPTRNSRVRGCDDRDRPFPCRCNYRLPHPALVISASFTSVASPRSLRSLRLYGLFLRH